jgi:hypothetical protein
MRFELKRESSPHLLLLLVINDGLLLLDSSTILCGKTSSSPQLSSIAVCACCECLICRSHVG